MDNTRDISIHPLTQEGMETKAKVLVKFNPYINLSKNQVEVNTVEEIPFYHKKIKDTRILGEFLKDKKKYSRFRRKRVLKDLLKFWEKDFKDKVFVYKTEMIEKTSKVKRKRIKRFSKGYIYLFGFICVLSILFSQRLAYLNKLPFVKTFVDNMYNILETPMYNNMLIGLIYLSLIASLYIIVIKTYFEEAKKVGTNSVTFINDEFTKLDRTFVKQHKELKSHLFRYMRGIFYKQNFKIKKLFDPQTIIKKLDNYSHYVEEKMDNFSKHYYMLLIINFLLKLSVLGLTGYLGYIYYITY